MSLTHVRHFIYIIFNLKVLFQIFFFAKFNNISKYLLQDIVRFNKATLDLK